MSRSEYAMSEYIREHGKQRFPSLRTDKYVYE